MALGADLDRDIAWRAAVTAGSAAAAWWVARRVGDRRGADTVALLALVGAQLGQTILLGRRDPAVAAAGLGSAALLVVIVEIPGISRLFGCRPLGPVGLAQAASAAAVGTAVSAAAPPLLRRLRQDGEGWLPEELVRAVTESRTLRRMMERRRGAGAPGGRVGQPQIGWRPATRWP